MTKTGKRRRHARKRASTRACDVCGELVKTHKLRVAMDGHEVASWRICAGCAAVKVVAMFGRGPTGMARGLEAKDARARASEHQVRQRAKRSG